MATIVDSGGLPGSRGQVPLNPVGAFTDDLRTLFKDYGELSEVQIPLDASKRPKGFAYVSFANPGEAVRAFRDQDNKVFMVRPVNHDIREAGAPIVLTSVVCERCCLFRAGFFTSSPPK